MERNYAVDFMKFFAIFAVVVIHTFPADRVMGFFIIDTLSRFAVPFFFVASGFLFGVKIINYEKSFTYFKKYVVKIVKIYFLWLFFYTVYDVIIILFMQKNVTQELAKYFDGFTILNVLYYGGGPTSGYHLWFLTALIWGIIFLFLFFRFNKINILLIISLVLNLIGLFGQSYSMFFKIPISTRDAMFLGLFYITLGFFFADHIKSTKLWRMDSKINLLFLCAFSLLQVAEGFFLDKALSGSHGEYFISTIFLTTFLFIFVLNNKQFGKDLWLTKIGAKSLSIYVIHVFIINIANLAFNAMGIHLSKSFLWHLVYSLFVFIISYGVYNLFKYLRSKLRGRIKEA
ncbi:acyltransferase [Bacillus sp. T33-2]|uniref:acyltransferase n=1 Tax=Bacillus sp. T33-2 TaxID=2054168 RepID=UPI0015E068F8|nr:acyltransferase [Bacillus sp. T33-2]